MDTYGSLFSSVSPPDDHPFPRTKKRIINTYLPLTCDEVSLGIRRQSASSPGPDGLVLADLKKLKIKELTSIMNVFLYLKDLPQALKRARTVLVPKKGDLRRAGNWRPIAISSMLVRLFHNILGKRLCAALDLIHDQQAFLPTDGAMANTLIVDYAVNRSRKKRRPLSMVAIDLAKAFDTVSTHSIRRSLGRLGLEPEMTHYIMNTFSGATTYISCGDVLTETVDVRRGVKQGDPISPILFNSVIDELLDSIPGHLGVNIDGIHLAAVAYADDITFLSSSEYAMRKILDIAQDFFTKRGLQINVGKCLSLVLRKNTKSGKILTCLEPTFTIHDVLIPILTSTDSFTYLGVAYDGNGKMKNRALSLESKLELLNKAPLKPMQKIIILRMFLIPRYVHVLTLGRLVKGTLKSLDAKVREFCKRTLTLPHYLPDSFLYTSMRDGGLRILSFSTNMPLNFLNRLAALRSNKSPAVRAIIDTAIVKSQAAQARSILGDIAPTPTSLEIKNYHRKRWCNSVYGTGLDQVVPAVSNFWLGNYVRHSNGNQPIQAIKLRANLLPCRGAPANPQGERHCRFGCGRVESLYHISQGCPLTHTSRVERHDRISAFTLESIKDKKWLNIREPNLRFENEDGNIITAKPDIILISQTRILVCDWLPWDPAFLADAGAPRARPSRLVDWAKQERTSWDTKDGELCLGRTKPEETLVEVRSDSDVQIDRQTNRTI